MVITQINVLCKIQLEYDHRFSTSQEILTTNLDRVTTPTLRTYEFQGLYADQAFEMTRKNLRPNLALFATGGYGRSVLAPSSDIDLLFVRPYKASAHAESVIEYMLYMLWDMGLKIGHAFRTPQECIRLAKDDVTIKTSLLDARFLFGDTELASTRFKDFWKD